MKTLIVAPHPDDELLGCGGTLLRRVAEGGTLGWILMTSLTKEGGWPLEKIWERQKEIDQVQKGLGVESQNLFSLGFATSQLDRFPMNSLVSQISQVFKRFQPEEVFLPYPGDAHSDHRITFEAAIACTKWFRYPSVRRVLVYETPSETDFGLNPNVTGFKPNYFVDISDFFEHKIELMSIYTSEMGEFPFPRSVQSLKALGHLRGAQAGFMAAEGFMLLRESI